MREGWSALARISAQTCWFGRAAGPRQTPEPTGLEWNGPKEQEGIMKHFGGKKDQSIRKQTCLDNRWSASSQHKLVYFFHMHNFLKCATKTTSVVCVIFFVYVLCLSLLLWRFAAVGKKFTKIQDMETWCQNIWLKWLK